MGEAANAAETQQRAFDNPVEEQTAVFSAQQDGSYRHTCTAAQAGVVVGNFRLCGTFSFLSVSLLHRLSTPLFWGMWGREVPLQP